LQQTALTLSIVAIEIATFPFMALWLLWMDTWFTNTLLLLLTGVRCTLEFVMLLQGCMPSLEDVLEEKFSRRLKKKRKNG
jgi:hypothetical protein